MLTIDQKVTHKFVLASGRRPELAQTAPTVDQPREAKDKDLQVGQAWNKLRALADPVNTSGTLPRGASAGANKGTGGLPVVPTLPKKSSGPEQMYFQSGVTSSGSAGVYMTTQALLSADGQSMRLSVRPVFQPSAMTGARTQVDVPLIPGGN